MNTGAIMPTSSGNSSVAMFSSPAHPNAAKVFANWLLSQQAQADWTKLNSDNSRRLDVPPGDPKAALSPDRQAKYVNFVAEANQPDFDAAVQLGLKSMAGH